MSPFTHSAMAFTTFAVVMAVALASVWRSNHPRYLLQWALSWALYAVVWPLAALQYARVGNLSGFPAGLLEFVIDALAFAARTFLVLGTAAWLGWRAPSRALLVLVGAALAVLAAGNAAILQWAQVSPLPAWIQLPFRTYFVGAIAFSVMAVAVFRSRGERAPTSRRLFGAALSASALSDLWDVALHLAAGSWVTPEWGLRLSVLGSHLCDTLFATGMMVAAIGTERERAERAASALLEREAQLQRAQRLESIGQLAGGLAHDFNNLLTAIVASLSMVRDRVPPGDGLQEDIEAATQAAQRAARLTRQLLTFSRRQTVEPRLLDLNQSLTGLDRIVLPLLGERIERRLRLAPDLWPVQADPAQVEQLLLNLVINARDAMPEGGVCTLETANLVLRDGPRAPEEREAGSGEWVRLAVEDTGHGMDAAVQARIFEPFFTTKGLGRGSGLGLATVLGIVQRAAGHVGVRSAPGAGTRMVVLLPRQHGKVAPSVSRSGPAFAGTETLLLVEDEDLVRNAAARILASRGYRVLQAPNGREALKLLEATQEVALVVSDVVMPEMGGAELARELGLRRPGLPVLLMSGYASGSGGHPETLDRPFLAKPFTPEQLAERVRELLDSAIPGSAALRAERSGSA